MSGKRLWDLFVELSEGDPYKFFKDCFIYNYFPLALMNKNAKNITPGDLKVILQNSSFIYLILYRYLCVINLYTIL